MLKAHQDRDAQAILVILPTWVGDFVMATPMLRAVRSRFAKARIVFLAEANLSDLIRGGDWMNEVIEWPARDRRMPWHSEYRELVFDLRKRRFDLAILLPNSFRSALVARLAGAKRRIGYNRDGRGFLLTDRVPVRNREENWWRSGVILSEATDLKRDNGTTSDHRGVPTSSPSPRPSPWNGEGEQLPGPRIWPGAHAAVRMGSNIPTDLGPYRPMPLVEYYADLAEAIGCERPGDRLELLTTPDCDESAQERLTSLGIATHHPLIIITPGAKFGASKCWPPDRFAAVADQLIDTVGATVIITCGPGEEAIAREIARDMKHWNPAASSSATADLRSARLGKEGGVGFVFDNPRLSLGELKSLIRRSDLLLCNDAGPRHIAKAFDVPVVTIFGPTHPDWTATSYEHERIVRMDIDCGPCQQKVCPLKHHQCMTAIHVDIVHAACMELLNLKRRVTVEPICTAGRRSAAADGNERALAEPS